MTEGTHTHSQPHRNRVEKWPLGPGGGRAKEGQVGTRVQTFSYDMNTF